MKKLLYLISAATIVSGTMLPTLNLYTTININTNLKADGITWYAPTSMENIINDIDNAVGDVHWVPRSGYEIDTSMQGHVQEQYDKFINGKEGSVSSLKMTPKSEVVLQTFKNTYTNDTPSAQTFKTQEYSKTITDTHTFSYNFSEKVTVKTSFNVPFIGGTDFSLEVGSQQQWTDTKTTSETLNNPSQSFTVSAKSVGTALYIIKQGTYHNDGVIRYNVDLNNDTIDSMYYISDSGTWSVWTYSMKDLIKLLVDHGYGEQIKNSSSQYSIISTDNPNNPSSVFLNLPISWDSQGGKLNVTFSEKPL